MGCASLPPEKNCYERVYLSKQVLGNVIQVQICIYIYMGVCVCVSVCHKGIYMYACVPSAIIYMGTSHNSIWLRPPAYHEKSSQAAKNCRNYSITRVGPTLHMLL